MRQSLIHLVPWLLAIVVLAWRGDQAWHAFDNEQAVSRDRWRDDGNEGHTRIDFAGQWLMGRIVCTGHGPELYDRRRILIVLRDSFPVTDESPWVRANHFPKAHGIKPWSDDDPAHDWESLAYKLMGHDAPQWHDVGRAVAMPFAADSSLTAAAFLVRSHQLVDADCVREVTAKRVGGALYPPLHGIVMAPLGLLRPATAYRIAQVCYFVCLVLAAWGAAKLVRQLRLMPWAVLFIALYPGCRANLELAQNACVTLFILVWGWWYRERGWPVAAGIIWSCLAFKPSWWLAFFLVPLFLREWRFALAMLGSSIVVCSTTLPVVGVGAWFDWLAVGREASETYNVNQNWIGLSRDLAGLPRRLLVDFQLPESQRGSVMAAVLGWALWGVIAAIGYSFGRHRDTLGVLMACYLLCYRFMYYDAVLSILPLWLAVCEVFVRRSWFNVMCACAAGGMIVFENAVVRNRALPWFDERIPYDTLVWLILLIARFWDRSART